MPYPVGSVFNRDSAAPRHSRFQIPHSPPRGFLSRPCPHGWFVFFGFYRCRCRNRIFFRSLRLRNGGRESGGSGPHPRSYRPHPPKARRRKTRQPGRHYHRLNPLDMGSRLSFPSALGVILTPGGDWRRLYSLASTILSTLLTMVSSKPISVISLKLLSSST